MAIQAHQIGHRRKKMSLRRIVLIFVSVAFIHPVLAKNVKSGACTPVHRIAGVDGAIQDWDGAICPIGIERAMKVA